MNSNTINKHIERMKLLEDKLTADKKFEYANIVSLAIDIIDFFLDNSSNTHIKK
jgi:hypothetical protein